MFKLRKSCAIGCLGTSLLFVVGIIQLRKIIVPIVIEHDQCSELAGKAFQGDLQGAKIALQNHGNKPCKGEFSSLIAAVTGKNNAVVKLFLDHNADPNEQDMSWPITPITIAVEDNNIEALKLFALHGANWKFKDRTNETILDRAALNGSTETIKYLLTLPELRDIKMIDGALDWIEYERPRWPKYEPDKYTKVIKLLKQTKIQIEHRKK